MNPALEPPRFSLGALMALLASGCGCLSSQEVRAKIGDLRSQNRARAEPAMRAAAQERGAVLLSLEPQEIHQRLPCSEGSDEAAPLDDEMLNDSCLWAQSERSGCEQSGHDRRSFVIRQRGESPKLIVLVREAEGRAYARLARRGDELIVLLPRLTSRTEVGSVTECECDGMPRVACPTTFGFVLDDVPADLKIEEASVPMSEEHLRTVCKTTGL